MNRIKICGITYRISLRSLPDKCGLLDRTENEIVLEKTNPPDQRLLALIHEIIHAINGELSETDVDYLATALHGVLVDNGWWGKADALRLSKSEKAKAKKQAFKGVGPE